MTKMTKFTLSTVLSLYATKSHTSDKGRIVIFVIDIVLESGAREHNHTFQNYHLNIDGYTISKIWKWS
jgi:hypothetical protein